MRNLLLSPWTAILVCTILSTLTDTLGTLWWDQKHSSLLLATITLSPLPLLPFGYIGSHFGLTRASSLTNTLIAADPILGGITLLALFKATPA